jgi:hypothetical protein
MLGCGNRSGFDAYSNCSKRGARNPICQGMYTMLLLENESLTSRDNVTMQTGRTSIALLSIANAVIAVSFETSSGIKVSEFPDKFKFVTFISFPIVLGMEMRQLSLKLSSPLIPERSPKESGSSIIEFPLKTTPRNGTEGPSFSHKRALDSSCMKLSLCILLHSIAASTCLGGKSGQRSAFGKGCRYSTPMKDNTSYGTKVKKKPSKLR